MGIFPLEIGRCCIDDYRRWAEGALALIDPGTGQKAGQIPTDGHPDYERIASQPTGFGAQTGFFVPEWGKLFVATRRQQGGLGGEILVYETK